MVVVVERKTALLCSEFTEPLFYLSIHCSHLFEPTRLARLRADAVLELLLLLIPDVQHKFPGAKRDAERVGLHAEVPLAVCLPGQ